MDVNDNDYNTGAFCRKCGSDCGGCEYCAVAAERDAIIAEVERTRYRDVSANGEIITVLDADDFLTFLRIRANAS